jgi:hypothetical protein
LLVKPIKSPTPRSIEVNSFHAVALSNNYPRTIISQYSTMVESSGVGVRCSPRGHNPNWGSRKISIRRQKSPCLKKKHRTKRRHNNFKLISRRIANSSDESSESDYEMESPSDNDSYHTGEETSDDGNDSEDHNLSDGGSDCDDDDDDNNKNNAPKTCRKSTKKKGRATSATPKQSAKGASKLLASHQPHLLSSHTATFQRMRHSSPHQISLI